MDESESEDDGPDDDDDSDSESDNDNAAALEQFLTDQQTFQEEMWGLVTLFKDFLLGLQYQIQFNDQRPLASLHREAAGAIRFIGTCNEKERRQNNNHIETPCTVDPTLSSAMFWRLRPAEGNR